MLKKILNFWKSLRKISTSGKLVPNSSGNIPRQKLSFFFDRFVEANEYATRVTNNFAPMVYLVYSRNQAADTAPATLPIPGELLPQIDAVFTKAAQMFNPTEFTLELLLYANNADDGRVIIGGRDLGGATAHALCDKISSKDGFTLKRVVKTDQSLNIWLPPSGNLPEGMLPVNDEFLKALAAKYTLAVSLNNLSL